MIAVNIKADLKPLQRGFINLNAKQVPFASALALNRLAKGVAEQERQEIAKDFKKHTPFTDNAYRIVVATKSRPIAYVLAKDIQAQYLEPYVDGGMRFLGNKKAMLAPITNNIALNQYGNLPKGKVQQMKGKPGYFIGPVKTKNGIINGVWRRTRVAQGRRGHGRKGVAPAAQTNTLQLLIKFTDTSPVPHRLNFYGRARDYLKANAAHEFGEAMKQALATAR